jgi:antitoxin (DNA-binding transcriptional repressor) of toxin-antitoxin stability system
MAARKKTVGVRELRQNLSVHLARVKKGQALTVTEHGLAVAELRPLPAKDDAVARLIADGRVTPPRRSPASLPAPIAFTGKRPVSALLDDLRDDDR